MTEDNESKTDDERILDTLARIRGVVLKDPKYDWHLAGMVSCPLECALIIEQFVNERENKLAIAIEALEALKDHHIGATTLKLSMDKHVDKVLEKIKP